ncbi:MAG TPA: phage holin family protein [Gammaproteobacteria bacterium]|nr:phage holin family protein [Gammaproteobacteria bacterium]
MTVDHDRASAVGDPPSGEGYTGPVSGLLRSLTNLFATLVGIAQTRLELLTTELQEEIHRAAGIMVWAFVTLFAAGVGLFLAALVVIFIFWDTHRLLVSVLVTSLFFGIAIVAALVLRAKVRSKPHMLDGTLAELAKDREQLQNRLRR